MTGPQRPLPPAAIAALAGGRKIEAIKILREEWHLGLKEAKDQVDDYIRQNPSVFHEQEKKNASFVWLLAVLVLAAAAYYFLRSH